MSSLYRRLGYVEFHWRRYGVDFCWHSERGGEGVVDRICGWDDRYHRAVSKWSGAGKWISLGR